MLGPGSLRPEAAGAPAAHRASGIGNVGEVGGVEDLPEDDGPSFRPPLPPEDRIWRHPSEMTGVRFAAGLQSRSARRQEAPGSWSLALLGAVAGATLVTATLAFTVGLGGAARAPSASVQGLAGSVVSMGPPSSPVVSTSTVPLRTVADGVGPAVARLELSADGRSWEALALGLGGSDLVTVRVAVDGATRLRAVLPDGSREPVSVVAADPGTGIAVLRLAVGTMPAAPFGSAVGLGDGSPVLALGRAPDRDGLGAVPASITDTAVSHVVDGVAHTDLVRVDLGDLDEGAALIDRSGEVVGLALGGWGGQGYAITADVAVGAAHQLRRGGKVTPVMLGVAGSDLPAAEARDYGIEGAALVGSVLAGGPAEAAGIQPGDAVVAVDGRRTPSMASVLLALKRHAPGDRVAVSYLRAGTLSSVTVTLAARPD